jgi:hypothetical protein
MAGEKGCQCSNGGSLPFSVFQRIGAGLSAIDAAYSFLTEQFMLIRVLIGNCDDR